MAAAFTAFTNETLTPRRVALGARLGAAQRGSVEPLDLCAAVKEHSRVLLFTGFNWGRVGRRRRRYTLLHPALRLLLLLYCLSVWMLQYESKRKEGRLLLLFSLKYLWHYQTDGAGGRTTGNNMRNKITKGDEQVKSRQKDVLYASG